MNKHNFSQAEIEKFNLMAPEWWDLNGPMKPLHQINPIRTDYILSNLNLINLSGLKILDIGCGGGILSESMAKLEANVTGIDMSSDAINVAKLHSTSQEDTKNLPLHYIHTSIENFSQQNTEQYDVITCLELLEHVPDPKGFLTYVKKLLKPNGKLFISTLNRNLKSYIVAIVGAEYIMNMIPRGTHEYNKFIKPSELATILRENNLKIKNIKGISYSIFSNNFYLSNDTDVNYITYIENS